MKACLITALLSGLLIATHSSADPGWDRLRVPGFWEAEYGGTIKSHDGYAWYRCFVKVPADWKGDALSLSLGRIDDCDETYFNGHRIGGMGSLKPYRTASGIDRRYVVAPARVNYGGYNLIAVRVWDGGGAGGISAGPLLLGGAAGGLVLKGNWEFRIDDDPSRNGRATRLGPGTAPWRPPSSAAPERPSAKNLIIRRLPEPALSR